MFSMYNYIQNTNNEIDAAQEVCNELDVVMEKYKEEQLQLEAERKAELEELTMRLRRCACWFLAIWGLLHCCLRHMLC